MKKYLLQITTLSLLLACQSTPTQKEVTKEPSISSQDTTQSTNILTSEKAQTWLKEAIVNYFEGDNQNMEAITTPKYAEFKNEAMNVDLGIDGSLSQQQFDKKWSAKYDLKTHPIHTGFLISGQDWDHITIEECIQKKDENENDAFYTFKVILEDKNFQSKYNRDITIQFIDGKFLISDIKEYD